MTYTRKKIRANIASCQPLVDFNISKRKYYRSLPDFLTWCLFSTEAQQ